MSPQPFSPSSLVVSCSLLSVGRRVEPAPSFLFVSIIIDICLKNLAPSFLFVYLLQLLLFVSKNSLRLISILLTHGSVAAGVLIVGVSQCITCVVKECGQVAFWLSALAASTFPGLRTISGRVFFWLQNLMG